MLKRACAAPLGGTRVDEIVRLTQTRARDAGPAGRSAPVSYDMPSRLVRRRVRSRVASLPWRSDLEISSGNRIGTIHPVSDWSSDTSKTSNVWVARRIPLELTGSLECCLLHLSSGLGEVRWAFY